MFTRLNKTQYPPTPRAVMAWDGDCGFCHYWVIKWKKLTADRIRYQPYQQVYKEFPDIDLKYFQQAIRLIDTDGSVYTGPAAVFHALNRHAGSWRWVMPLYRRCRLFGLLSDHFYAFVSRHRIRMYAIAIRLFGRNPAKPRYYWAWYLGGFALALLLLLGWFLV